MTLPLLMAEPLVAQERPNIVLFLVDDMGLMDTSVPFVADENGVPQRQPLNDWYRTPNMETLADYGTRFTTFYAQSVSTPSRISILTGQSSARHRTTNWIHNQKNNRDDFGPYDWNWMGMDGNTVSYPKLLQQAGYKTIHIGKAHLGNDLSESKDPRVVGYDVNIAGGSMGHPGSYLGENGYGHIKGTKRCAVPDLEKYHRTPTFLTEALTLEAKKELEKAVSEGRPFYLNMAHYAVHAPFEADHRFIDHYAGTLPDVENARQYRQARVSAPAFATLIEGMDKSLGDIMRTLDELGVAENTIIIFLGDNGGDAPLGDGADYGSCAPFKGKKGSEYEGGDRVPFIISWAKPDSHNRLQKRIRIGHGKVQNQMATILDLFPTVLELASIEAPKGYEPDGSSLSRLMRGKSDRKHRDDFLMHFPHKHRGSYFTSYRKGDWKLIYYYHPETGIPSQKLFNLKKDPFEYQDVSSTHPDKVVELCQLMIDRLQKENALYPVDKNGKVLYPIIPQFGYHSSNAR